MKKIVQYIFVLITLVMFSGAYGCLKDAPYLEPEPEPFNEPTTVGVRLQVDSIVCLSDWDDSQYHDYNVELYGFIRAYATYEYTISSPPVHHEKKDTALLWYRDANQWVQINEGDIIRLNPPDPNRKITVERGYVDFYCDINKTHQCKIHLFPFLMDWDDNSWNPQLDDDLYRVRNDLLDNKTSWTMEELLTQGGKKRILLKYPSYTHPSNYGSEIYIHFSIYPINEYNVIFPEGKGPDMEFKEADHIIPDPPRSVSMYLPPSSTSQRLVVAQVPAQVLALSPMSATIDGIKYSVYNYRPNYLSLANPINPVVFESRNLDASHDEFVEKWVGLVRNDALHDIYYRKPFREEIGQKYGDFPLKSKPYLQLIKYWRLVDSQQIPKGKIQKVGRETKVGISHTYGHELSITTGIGGSGIFDIFSFNVEVKNTFSSSYTYQLEETVSTEDVYGPYDVEVRCNVWQEIHEFRVVDENGKLFNDPNYEFKSVVVATVPVDNFYEDIQEFK